MRINGVDVRDATLESIDDIVGVVTQDAHLFHETIRANLRYAKPDATDDELIEALQRRPDPAPGGVAARRARHRWSAIAATGCRAARSSASPSPACCSRRPTSSSSTRPPPTSTRSPSWPCSRRSRPPLAGRTSLVIAHRLSTVREADVILVVDEGRIVEQGRHDELLAAGGLYAELYRTQFAQQADDSSVSPAEGAATQGAASAGAQVVAGDPVS